MAFSLWHKASSELHVVVDIGSYAIKAITFQVFPGGAPPKPVKKAMVRLPLRLLSEKIPPKDPRRLLPIVARLRELLFITIKELGRVPERITLALGSSLADIELITWGGLPQGTGSTISSKELQQYFRELEAHHATAGSTVFNYPIGLLANGYAVSRDTLLAEHPRTLHDVSFRVVSLRIPEEVGERISEMRQSFGGMPITFIPLVAAHQESIPRALDVAHAFLLDIGGETTSLAYLYGGELLFFTSFPFGAHHFLRELAVSLSVPLETAEQMKRQYVLGLVTGEKKLRIGEVFSRKAAEWELKFMQALESAVAVGPFAEDILLFGGGAYITEIVDRVRTSEWLRTFSHLQTPKVRVVSPTRFLGGDSLDGFLQGPEDVGLASLILYSLHHEPLL